MEKDKQKPAECLVFSPGTPVKCSMAWSDTLRSAGLLQASCNLGKGSEPLLVREAHRFTTWNHRVLDCQHCESS